MDRIELVDAYREILKENIEYGCMVSRYGKERVDETVELMLEVVLSKRPCHITQQEVNAVFDGQVRLCADTLQKKTKEYTGDDTDRLGAFKAAAALQLHRSPGTRTK